MTSFAVNSHEKKPKAFSEWVWFTGSTALKEGQGVCYDFDSGTASAADGRRSNRVELPSITNARYFAGVAARDYAAVTGGQLIEIYGPGSWCNIYAKANCTLGSGRLTCEAGGTYAGYFRYAGFEGEGSAVPLQTVNRASTAGKVFAKLEEGPASGLLEVVTPTAGAITCMVGGVTLFAAADIASNATFTLADGTLHGQRKCFSAIGEIATSDIVVTVTSGIQGVANNSPTTALATITLSADEHETVLEWLGVNAAGGLWVCQYNLGSTLA